MTKKSKLLPIIIFVFGALATSFSSGQNPPPDPPLPQPPPQPGQPIPQPPQPGPLPQPPIPPPVNPQPESEPVIVEQPQNQQVKVGATATFKVRATGNPAPSYQWRVNGTAINGAKNSAYTTGPTTAANDGESYTVTVSNGVGNPVTSDPANLTVVLP
jgi:hypothetical protein